MRVAAWDVRHRRSDALARHLAMEDASILIADDVGYVALYERWPASPYPLYAIRRRDGKVLWSARVWADDGFITGLYTGQGSGVVELRVRGDEVTVFGASIDVAYVEVFARANGRCRARFSTRYYDVAPPSFQPLNWQRLLGS